MKALDAYCHVLPSRYFARLEPLLRESTNPRIAGYQPWPAEFPALHDFDRRWQSVDGIDEYSQVVSLAVPPLEELGDAALASELARLANEEMAQLRDSDPQRIAGFAASLALSDVEASIAELERAVTELGALGALLYTNVNGRPIDEPAFAPVFARAAELGAAIWLHPTKGRGQADYETEDSSRYGMWWAIGWPYETTIAMARLTSAGLFKRHPELTVITHHGGGMVPQFPDRVLEFASEEAQVETDDPRSELIGELRRFCADTVLSVPAALQGTIDFFGVERVLFATDMPFGPPSVVRSRIDVLNGMELPRRDLENIFHGNAERLLGID